MTTSWRENLIAWLFLVWGAVVILRLGYWQTYKAPALRSLAMAQQTSSIVIPASRGQILFSDHFPMVTNADNYLLYVDPLKLPSNLDELIKIVDSLPASESAKDILSSAPSRTHLSWLAVTARVSPEAKQAINNLKIPGLGFELSPWRSYPESTASAYISGFVGKNDQSQPQGYFGLEGFYDRLLSGTFGRLIQEQDAFGLPIVIGSRHRIPPKDGNSLVTSIDRTVQFIAAQELSAALEKYHSPAGSITVLESNSGRVLAMVSEPGYDPSLYSQFDPSLYKNPIVSDSYEPGSTFKSLVMAAALDAGAVTAQTVCDNCAGPVTIGDSTIRSFNDKYYPNSSMIDVILHSDNVGMVFVSRKLGKRKLLEYLRRFGIGTPTGIDLQEEDVPSLRPDDQWRDIDWATVSFGQGIALTPLQMVAAVNAIANSGIYTPPRVVTSILSGLVSKPVASPKSWRVISVQSAAQVTQMMVNGVTDGEVRYYRPPGYLIAGKTGTAQVPIAGHYDPDKVIASFVGFAPADNPKFTMLVTLRDPKPSPWGSTTAAPTWFNVARRLFSYYRIAPMVN